MAESSFAGHAPAGAATDAAPIRFTAPRIDAALIDLDGTMVDTAAYAAAQGR